MKETDVWHLMAKVLAKDATPEEFQQLQDIFREKPEMQQSFVYLQNLKVNIGDKFLLSDEEIKRSEDKGFIQIEKMLSFENSPKKEETKVLLYQKYKGWLVAASVLFMIGLAAFFFLSREAPLKQNINENTPLVETFVATEAISIELEDGTKVWLNRGSTLRCHKQFNKGNREVFLKGEGFFNVSRDAATPFIVHLKKGIKIKVLGTRFNVKAYPNTPFIEASLLSGKIVLDLNKDQKNIVMKPHEKITINTDQLEARQTRSHPDTITVQKAQLKPNPLDQQLAETAWMDNRLSFYDMPFEELAYELERYYGKEFIFKDKRLKTWHLTGSFKEETLHQVLDALQITTPFQYKVIDNKVILSSNSKK